MLSDSENSEGLEACSKSSPNACDDVYRVHGIDVPMRKRRASGVSKGLDDTDDLPIAETDDLSFPLDLKELSPDGLVHTKDTDDSSFPPDLEELSTDNMLLAHRTKVGERVLAWTSERPGSTKKPPTSLASDKSKKTGRERHSGVIATHVNGRTFPSLLHTVRGLRNDMNKASMGVIVSSIRMQKYMEDQARARSLSQNPAPITKSKSSQRPKKVTPMSARQFTSYYAEERSPGPEDAAAPTHAPGALAAATESQVPPGDADKKELSAEPDAASIEQKHAALEMPMPTSPKHN